MYQYFSDDQCFSCAEFLWLTVWGLQPPASWCSLCSSWAAQVSSGHWSSDRTACRRSSTFSSHQGTGLLYTHTRKIIQTRCIIYPHFEFCHQGGCDGVCCIKEFSCLLVSGNKMMNNEHDCKCQIASYTGHKLWVGTLHQNTRTPEFHRSCRTPPPRCRWTYTSVLERCLWGDRERERRT